MIPRFRAWDKRKNVMRDVAVLHFTKNGKTNFIEYWINPTELKSYHVRNIDLMQSTGLIDRNGVEIFDGDVVQAEQYLTTTIPVRINGIVKYSNRYTMFYLDNGSERHDLYMQSLGGSIYNFEVIGNIYENSELLEEQ
ncbi:TPA: YopX family protein [Enterococcus faecium]|uniref:YopX family protein n=1 Tax=Enterococcus faecium TaxID=1352 RepID=UPI0018972C31|nr:YopX family protein [Enterococcus faecium]